MGVVRSEKPKVFFIGANKTGTTSCEAAMKDLGYKLPLQKDFEMLFDDWVNRDFRRIVKMVRDFDAFQDVPFSLPFTFIVLDHCFPGSKFILTVRENEEDWYKSMTAFHAQLWGKDGHIPTREDLVNAVYHYKGRPDHTNRHLFNTPYDKPYHKESLIHYYKSHNDNVKKYFQFRQDDLLVLDVAKEDSYIKLCSFLDCEPIYSTFPWKNKT